MRRAFVLAVSLALAGAAGASAGTIVLGRGIHPWRIGQKYVKRPGLVRSDAYPRNNGAGCDLGPRTASRIDYYRGLRVAWRGGPKLRTSYLIDVATTRTGDRSGDGFTIGVDRLGAVRRVHPVASVSHPSGPLALGRTAVTISRLRGQETVHQFVYWFDARGVLSGLETLASGC